jgi:hypothetical protein
LSSKLFFRRYPAWQEWLSQQGLSHVQEPDLPLGHGEILKKYKELCDIVQEMLPQAAPTKADSQQLKTQGWMPYFVNEINVKLWRWQNSLPAELRWSLWGSKSDVIHPMIATLQ